jgi:catechol 2,3-dioxygenase-like lactoylglutathione lyase family enzyme
MNDPVPELTGVVETALYVDDLDRSVRFYHNLFGFEEIAADPGRLRALSVSGRQVLLIFKKRASSDHDGDGRLHLAFAVREPALSQWETRLARHDITIEMKKTWERGGRSVYFRDPDGHLLELVTPGCWSIY